MPDLMEQSFWYCESLDSWEGEILSSKGDKTYTVKFDGRDWSCTCPAFTYYEGECKHIKQAKETIYCGWSEFVNMGKPTKIHSWRKNDFGKEVMDTEYVCPLCGRPAKTEIHKV